MTSFLMILYHITNLLYGVIVYSLGPIVPYLAEETGLTEGHFTYLFIIKGITFMSTCLLKVTILKDHSNLHQAMWIGCLLSGIGTFIFTATRETSLMIIAMIIMSIGVCIIDIYIGVCILAEGKDDPRSHLSISFGLQSLGSVIGPVLVSIMGIPSLYISALLISLCFIAFISKNDPIRQQETEYGEKIKFLTPKLRYYLCGIMLFYAVL